MVTVVAVFNNTGPCYCIDWALTGGASSGRTYSLCTKVPAGSYFVWAHASKSHGPFAKKGAKAARKVVEVCNFLRLAYGSLLLSITKRLPRRRDTEGEVTPTRRRDSHQQALRISKSETSERKIHLPLPCTWVRTHALHKFGIFALGWMRSGLV